MKSIAVIPCYNEGKNIKEILCKLNNFVSMSIVADDNSGDNTVEEARSAGACVVQNSGKRGFGSNSRFGIRTALAKHCDIVVILDGDGQHNPMECPQIVSPIENEKYDIVIGSRFLRDNKNYIPLYRKVGIKIITLVLNIGHKQKFSDVQCCFRAFRSEVLRNMELTENGFTYSVEMLIKARQMGYRIKEIPVNVTYHKQLSRNSTMNPVKQGLEVLWGVIRLRFRMEIMNNLKSWLYRMLMKYVIPHLERRGLGNIALFDKIYKKMFGLLVPIMQKEIVINNYRMSLKFGGKWGLGGIAKSLVFNGEYEPQTTVIFKKIIKPGMRVVDVGANLGYYTLLSSKLVGDNGKVWAFEPEIRNFSMLQDNLALNDMHNVIAIKKAISDINNKHKTLYVSEWERGESSVIKGVVRSKMTEEIVETIRLDDIIEDKIDIIKTDTEGYELSVLKSAEKLLSNDNMKLIVELFPQSYKLAEYSTATLHKYLLDRGFKYCYILDELNLRTILIDDINKWHKYSGNVLYSRNPIEGINEID